MECGSEEKPRGTALQSVLGSKHQESCVSSSSVLTAASQKLPAERNQEICQARSAVRVVCTSQHCVRRTSKEERRMITSPPHKQQYDRLGRTGQREGCSLQNCDRWVANWGSETSPRAWHLQLSCPLLPTCLPGSPTPGLHSPSSAPLLLYLADGLRDPVPAAGLDEAHGCLQAHPVAHRDIKGLRAVAATQGLCIQKQERSNT